MQEMSLPEESDKLKHVEHPDPETAHLSAAAAILAGPLGAGVTETEAQLALAAAGSLNPRRALALTARLAASLDKWPEAVKLNRERLAAVVKLCGASDFFGETLAGNPSLINAVPLSGESPEAPDYQALLRQAVTDAPDLSAALSGLRRAWSPLFLAIGARDAAGRITRREATRRQTALAEAALCAAQIVAEQELARRHSLPFSLSPSLPLAILGLGRLGSGGMDYGSDLDLVLVYDDTAPPPALTHAEGYRRLAELLALALSSLTRDGYLYRVDLRLRPDGRNGPTVSAASAFLSYLRERAAPWEWLAYVKLRATAGGDWAIALENKARTTIHEAAQALPREQLRDETRRMRARLEAERAQKRPREVDIKYGAGGLLDVYFAARYLQLRDNVPDTGAERSTTVTLKHLLEAGSLSKEAYAELSAGYEFLRELDHRLRLVSGRSTRLPAAGHAVLEDIAKGLSCKTAENLLSELRNHTRLVRVWHDKLTTQL
jgi:glutamate-ammonia-ligase adenylyltransferase